MFLSGERIALDLPFIWVGNLCGACLTAFLESQTRAGANLMAKAQALCEVKLGDNLLSIFIFVVFCNIPIFIAVDGYNSSPHEGGKYLSLFFGIVTFILCGFEHCVANMYYFSMTDMWSLKALGYVLILTLGNAAGGVIIPLLRKWKEKTT